MVHPEAVACSTLPAPMSLHDEYLAEAVALACRVNQRLAERTSLVAQDLVEHASAPPPLVGPAA
jgi:hypothetical protein